MPIFSSSAPQKIGLRRPSEPSAFGKNFGTRKSEIPLVPFGASGRRAKTKCTIFSAMSCSPAEIKIFPPVSLYEPSSCGSALERSMPRSVPQCASVRHMVPVHAPDTNLGRYKSFCAWLPCACRHSYAPCDRPGYMVQTKQTTKNKTNKELFK